MASLTTWRGATTAAAAVASLLLVAACGGSGETGSGEGGGGGIDPEITIAAVHDTTGPIAYAGVGADRGAEIAIEEINEQAFLGEGVTVSMESIDTANEIERATSEMTKALGNDQYNAIIGPAAAQQAAAVAPLVERQKVPTVFTQSGADGVVIGDYTFRATPPMETYYDAVPTYLTDNGLDEVAVITNTTFPTFDQLAQQFQGKAEEAGITVSQTVPVQSTTQDFTAPAQQIAEANPKAVGMFLIAPQSVTFMTQLRQAGYEGQIVGTSVQAAGNVAEAGEAAAGLVYPVPFSAAQESETAKTFTETYETKFGELPDPYAADGYDAMWWIARGIKASGDSSREGIQAGMAQVASEGFDGVGGPLTFDGNDVRIEGTLVQWDGESETLVQ